MTLNLDEIEARANNATIGPWTVELDSNDRGVYRLVAKNLVAAPNRRYSKLEYYDVQLGQVFDPPLNAYTRDHSTTRTSNLDFISHSRTDIPNLIQAVRELSEALRSQVAIRAGTKEELNEMANRDYLLAKSVLEKWDLK